MNRKSTVVAIIIAVMSIAGIAGAADPSANPSYFEGVWSGTWDMGTKGQDVTITIGELNEKGAHKVTYEYGWGKYGNAGTIPPGSFVTYGRESNGEFVFWWKAKDGAKRTVTMQKEKEDVAKAKYDLEGVLTSIQKPYYSATLKRH